MLYANGLSTARHGALHVTGSYCNKGVSGFSFKGVNRAPMGTTRREASLRNISKVNKEREDELHHAGAWKRVPTKPNAIAILDLAPLVFQSFVVHGHSDTRQGSVGWHKTRLK